MHTKKLWYSEGQSEWSSLTTEIPTAKAVMMHKRVYYFVDIPISNFIPLVLPEDMESAPCTFFPDFMLQEEVRS